MVEQSVNPFKRWEILISAFGILVVFMLGTALPLAVFYSLIFFFIYLSFSINKKRKTDLLEANPAKIIRQEPKKELIDPLLCGSCGTLNAEGSIFCVEDGVKLGQVNNAIYNGPSVINIQMY